MLLVWGCSVVPKVPVRAPMDRPAMAVDRDERECAATAHGHERALAYAGCMIARGYTATVIVGNEGLSLRDGHPALWASVEPADVVHPPQRGAIDLVACRDVAREVRGSEHQAAALGVVAAPLTVAAMVPSPPIATTDPAAMPMLAEQRRDAMMTAFQECLTPRGFVVGEAEAVPPSPPRP